MDISHLATKADLEALRIATKADLEALRIATKADLEALRIATKADLTDEMLSLRNDMKMYSEKAREDSDRILEVVVNMNTRLGGKVDDHETRITALEGQVAVHA